MAESTRWISFPAGSPCRHERPPLPSGAPGTPEQPAPRLLPLTAALSAALLAALLAIPLATPPGAFAAAAQDANILFPVDTIEHRLGHVHFEVIDRWDTRFDGDRTQRVALEFPDGMTMAVKWARAPREGREFNNEPRYEIAAYLLQKLFLEPEEYVVPPIVARALPIDWYRELDPDVRPTFGGTASALVALQYWLFNVTATNFYDPDRFEADSAYARHLANMNILTFLIDHGDSNHGNFLLSRDSANPRVFAVDNGIAFASPRSGVGYEWHALRVSRVPQRTVDRLRAITRTQLEDLLGVVIQLEVQEDGRFQVVEPTENLGPQRPVRRRDGIIQLGLTRAEIRGVERRIERLLRDVDRGRLETF